VRWTDAEMALGAFLLALVFVVYTGEVYSRKLAYGFAVVFIAIAVVVYAGQVWEERK
jgi:hypothetical protein